MKKVISIITIIFLLSITKNAFAIENYLEECNHENGTVSSVDNKDGTHTNTCEVCGEKIKTEEHIYEDNICLICEAEQHLEECNHKNGTVSSVDNKDGTHTNTCEVCGEKIKTEEHIYEDNICLICEAEQHLEECNHKNGTISSVDNKDGTHTSTCEVCGEKIKTEEHKYENEVCTICDAVETKTIKELPNAGKKSLVINVSIIVMIIMGWIMYINNKKYKDII